MLSMVQGRLEALSQEKKYDASYKSPRFTKTMRILILQNVLDAILKSSRKKPAIRYFIQIWVNVSPMHTLYT